jgi:hypothetical protein
LPDKGEPVPIRYTDAFVCNLADDIGSFVSGETWHGESIRERLTELVLANCPLAARYWASVGTNAGVPDIAYRQGGVYLFADREPVRVFKTSGTTSSATGRAEYSPRGLELMDLAIVANARHHMIAGIDRPAIVRLVPSERDAPYMIMAHGMEHIARSLGDPELSCCVVRQGGVDFDLLCTTLERAQAADRPVVLIGATFGFVNICDALKERKRSWQLPAGSRAFDAGGFKGRSRIVTIDGFRGLIRERFGIPAGQCRNLFGMTELASQLYDCSDAAVGPLGERPKGACGFATPRVRDAQSLEIASSGMGLLEVEDLAILDRPFRVLSGDLGIACDDGVAVVGRVARSTSRGCSLSFDDVPRAGA